jgi:hypothetical protein
MTNEELRKWAEVGLSDTCRRFAEAMTAADRTRQFTSITELLAWIVALDDAHERRIGPDRKAAYRQQRDADEDGAPIKGLRWARHRGLHQLANLLTIADNPVSPLRHRRGTMGMLTWAARALVQGPPQEEEYRKEELEEAYDKAVRGRRAMAPIERAQTWLLHKVWSAFP